MRTRWLVISISSIGAALSLIGGQLTGRGTGDAQGCAGNEPPPPIAPALEARDEALPKPPPPAFRPLADAAQSLAPELRPKLEVGVDHLRDLATKKGIDVGPEGGLSFKRVFTDDLEMLHAHVQQTVGKIPVFGGEAILHLAKDGSLASITDELLEGITVDTDPKIKSEEAIAVAKRHLGCEECVSSAGAELMILRHGGADFLVHRVALTREGDSPSMPVKFIDAASGELIWEYDNLQTGTAPTLYSGTVSLPTYFRPSNNTYYLEDPTRKLGTFDLRNLTSNPQRITDPDDTWDAAAQRAAADAHYGAMKFFDYFQINHRRNGIDGSGGPALLNSVEGTPGLITSRVRFSNRYNGAFWNGTSMTYGDGDGVTFGSLVTLDICGHEMTHGIIQHTADLTYAGEPGALNEAIADIFGAMVERYALGESSRTWTIGEDCYTPGTPNDALRSLADPHASPNTGLTADDNPDHYVERYTGTADNGGVHVNSGIAAKAFHLLAQGGTHHRGGSMTGIGTDAAARIWYRALTTYMTSTTNFRGARVATLNAVVDLFGRGGAVQYSAVQQSWTLCGVN